jgi:hypothetical protein
MAGVMAMMAMMVVVAMMAVVIVMTMVAMAVVLKVGMSHRFALKMYL